ncbi:hypothetical protein R1sor_002510 [Riccia sorocarpa]|uniref:Thioredoxin domain-containing protein n=1 Tax=Riccia sorocarpa TaxID=122646 RepID=A0ABD3GZV6_9MARC
MEGSVLATSCPASRIDSPPVIAAWAAVKYRVGRRLASSQTLRGLPASVFPLVLSHGKERRRSRETEARIHIDRKLYFNESFKRQEEEEAREAEAEISCPVDCVREVRTYAEFERVLHDAEQNNALVVVDFYNSSCGSCKYILPQFIKLCKRGCGEECAVENEKGVMFIKHNVRDEYDDLTDLARFYSIRSVPMFSFFVDGCRIEQFPTRDRQKLEQNVQLLLTRYFN